MTSFTVIVSDWFAYALIGYVAIKIVKIVLESIRYYRVVKQNKKQLK